MGTVISRLRVRASARTKAMRRAEHEEKGFDDDEEVEDVEPELDPAEYEDDETYARVLQDAEEREGGRWSMSRITETTRRIHGKRLIQMSTLMRNLLHWAKWFVQKVEVFLLIHLLPYLSVTCNTKDMQEGNTEQCVICRVEFEEG